MKYLICLFACLPMIAWAQSSYEKRLCAFWVTPTALSGGEPFAAEDMGKYIIFYDGEQVEINDPAAVSYCTTEHANAEDVRLVAFDKDGNPGPMSAPFEFKNGPVARFTNYVVTYHYVASDINE